MNVYLAIGLIVVCALVAAIVGYVYGYNRRKKEAEQKIGSAEEHAKKLVDDAARKASEIKKEMELAAK